MKTQSKWIVDIYARETIPFKYNKLEEDGLLKIKTYDDGEFEGYKVLKYTRKAFYKSLWTPDLLQCRGLVLNEDDEIVVYPFTKVFNYGESGLGKVKTKIGRDRSVISIEKINGFMMAISKLRDDSFLYSSTGTLDSDFVKLGKEVIQSQCKNLNDLPYGITYMFEICHESDPHVVEEKLGAYLIGSRTNAIGSPLLSETSLDGIASDINAFRPSWKQYDQFSDAKKAVDESDREGAMIRSLYGGTHLCKIKSKYYLSKKFIMRGKAEKIWDGQVDEDYSDAVELIKQAYSKEEWEELNQHERRLVFENSLEVLEENSNEH